jgi:hypothetical protein
LPHAAYHQKNRIRLALVHQNVQPTMSKIYTAENVTNHVASGGGNSRIGADVWLRQRIAYSATVAIALAAAWVAGKLGLTAFWVVAAVALLLVFSSTRNVKAPCRSAGLWDDLWSAAIAVFDCRPVAPSTAKTEVTWLTASLIGNSPEIQPSWVKWSC